MFNYSDICTSLLFQREFLTLPVIQKMYPTACGDRLHAAVVQQDNRVDRSAFKYSTSYIYLLCGNTGG